MFSSIKIAVKKSTIIVALVILLIGYVIGRLNQNQPQEHSEQQEGITTKNKEEKAVIFTCSMHPQIRLPKKGKCPICFMDLIPLDTSSGENAGPRAMKMSESAMALADIQTTPIIRGKAAVELNLVGKVQVDPTKVYDIIMITDSEIRKLFVNYSGVPVKKGDHLAEIYSPDVYSAAQDLVIALSRKEPDLELVKTSEIKLKLYGVPEAYIEKIKAEKKAPETYSLVSKYDGYVENVMGSEGMWIKKGQMLGKVIDMSDLWILLDVYETDLPWIRYGQNVKISVTAVPGKSIDGIVSYIPPRIDEKTRTFKIRVNVVNSGDLKPGMFVSTVLKSEVTSHGKVTSSQLQGKWISPMHPEIIKDSAGTCDVCGMDLVKIEELGYTYDSDKELPLLLPVTSVLITGKRAVVYVRKTGEMPIFEGREVVLGPRAGNNYVVLEGLKENEIVVTRGNFYIDSALQIQAKPSMMSMAGGGSVIRNINENDGEPKFINNAKLRSSTKLFMNVYLAISEKLSSDSFEGMQDLAMQLKTELGHFNATGLTASESSVYEKSLSSLNASMEHLHHFSNIDDFRKQFKIVSKEIIQLVEVIGHPMPELDLIYCSMAEAQWLQTNADIKNPYYGQDMLTCGEMKRALSAVPVKAKGQ